MNGVYVYTFALRGTYILLGICLRFPNSIWLNTFLVAATSNFHYYFQSL